MPAPPALAPPFRPDGAGRRPFPLSMRDLVFEPAVAGVWRVVRHGGPAIGHVEEVESDGRVRYRVHRIGAGGVPTSHLGDFWSPRDAADCFR